MSRPMSHFLEDLKEFFSNSEDFNQATHDVEREVNEKMAEAIEADPAIAERYTCSRIRYGGNCGFASSGRKAYVVNGYNDARVRVTVRVRWSSGINRGQFDKVYTLAAGSERLLGCTRSGAIPVTSYSFSVVGCEKL